MLDRRLVDDVAGRLRSDPGLVEKDWHVTRALGVLAACDHGGALPAFGGGTSLSKGWGLIKRFSDALVRGYAGGCGGSLFPRLGHSVRPMLVRLAIRA